MVDLCIKSVDLNIQTPTRCLMQAAQQRNKRESAKIVGKTYFRENPNWVYPCFGSLREAYVIYQFHPIEFPSCGLQVWPLQWKWSDEKASSSTKK
jgi:hypothetical protein